MAAMLPSEHPYMRSTPFEIWKNRIPWLLLLMVSATLTGHGHLPALKTRWRAAMPDGVHPDADGHRRQLRLAGAASRSSAASAWTRSSSATLFKVVWKEIRVSVLCGVCLAVACFAQDHRWSTMLLLQEPRAVSYMGRASWSAPVDGRDGVSGQARRLDAAAAGQKARLRPGCHGLADHHHDRGLFVPAGSILHSQRPCWGSDN